MAWYYYNTNMIRTQIQFEKKTYEKLKARSKASGDSISEIVRRSLDENLEAQEVSQKWSRALKSLGQFESGHSDLAERHDAYLENHW